ncbi:hypothetical protein LADH09A_004885 [Micromonospora sp. LAH09]|uniref:hypothetical protein n=1 Tax=Micromonospora cabrerizensis TaxID=2911213 RepID=UPI001EE84A7B|nr:hypothetical protein [Micromonospora cabrerizensis]MCG5470913.1 hypothetical protein [Micromonospora cabrerizensis]
MAGMGRRSKVRLSLGAGTARKVRAAVLASPVLFVAGVLIWMPADLIVESLTEDPVNVWGSLVPHLFVAVGFMLGVYIVGAVGLAILAVIPYAWWLDGTLLGERRWLRPRWVDLSTADVSSRDDPRRDVVSVLVAHSAESGIVLKLPVSQGGSSLPSAELIALADALTGARVRDDSDDAAFAIADRLRGMAARHDARAHA